MSHACQMQDGTVIFASFAPGSRVLPQKEMEIRHAQDLAERAARCPAVVAYGRQLGDAMRSRGLGFGQIQKETGINAVAMSRLYRGGRMPTDAEQALLDDLLAKYPVLPKDPRQEAAFQRLRGAMG